MHSEFETENNFIFHHYSNMFHLRLHKLCHNAHGFHWGCLLFDNFDLWMFVAQVSFDLQSFIIILEGYFVQHYTLECYEVVPALCCLIPPPCSSLVSSRVSLLFHQFNSPKLPNQVS